MLHSFLLPFQSTPPRRRRRLVGDQAKWIIIFNPRLREGGDIGYETQFQFMKSFQSTPPRRRRPIRRFLFLRSDDIFNPRLREGGDEAGEVIKKLRNFSIHASAKEATTTFIGLLVIIIFSIHASAKEATSVTLSLLRLAEHFQSTPPRRRRRQLPVSTLFCHTSFQSTPPRRRRPTWQ